MNVSVMIDGIINRNGASIAVSVSEAVRTDDVVTTGEMYELKGRISDAIERLGSEITPLVDEAMSR